MNTLELALHSVKCTLQPLLDPEHLIAFNEEACFLLSTL